MHREVTDRSRPGIFSYRFLGKCMSEIYVSEIGRTIYIYIIVFILYFPRPSRRAQGRLGIGLYLSCRRRVGRGGLVFFLARARRCPALLTTFDGKTDFVKSPRF